MKQFFKRYALRGFFGGSSGDNSSVASTYVLVDEDGNEYPATLVSEETTFDATANDIRLGKVAVTDDGVVTGEKEIPSYHTAEGVVAVPHGGSYEFTTPYYDYTKMQGMVCLFNSSMADSVATEKVAINEAVYPVQSSEREAEITKNHDTSTVQFNVTNGTGVPCVIRFFMYKEEY